MSARKLLSRVIDMNGSLSRCLAAMIAGIPLELKDAWGKMGARFDMTS